VLKQDPSAKPRCYLVTGNAKETPDVWIQDVEKSVVLEVGRWCCWGDAAAYGGHVAGIE
jgi:hypothetical protein